MRKTFVKVATIGVVLCILTGCSQETGLVLAEKQEVPALDVAEGYITVQEGNPAGSEIWVTYVSDSSLTQETLQEIANQVTESGYTGLVVLKPYLIGSGVEGNTHPIKTNYPENVAPFFLETGNLYLFVN